MSNRGELLEEPRPVAFAIAYQMLGSASEAEDVSARARREQYVGEWLPRRRR